MSRIATIKPRAPAPRVGRAAPAPPRSRCGPRPALAQDEPADAAAATADSADRATDGEPIVVTGSRIGPTA